MDNYKLYGVVISCGLTDNGYVAFLVGAQDKADAKQQVAVYAEKFDRTSNTLVAVRNTPMAHWAVSEMAEPWLKVIGPGVIDV
jgi:hypothetical protein